MERYCGFLKRDGVRNRRNPYASLDTRVRHIAQLNTTKIRYDLVNLLSLAGPKKEVGEVFSERAYITLPSPYFLQRHFFTDPQRVLMWPRKMLKLDEDVRTKLTTALITRYSPLRGPKITSFVSRKYISTGPVLQWGRLQIAEGGDRMCCRAMIKPGSLGRDCTYIRVSLVKISLPISPPDTITLWQYEATVDRNARAKNKRPDMVLDTFFGELQRIIAIDIPATPQLNLKEPQKLFFAIVKQCGATRSKDGFWEYTTLGGLEAVDIGLVQCVVGRVFDRGKWVIIDRSGDRAHADIETGRPE
jgi:hypothetical protein